MKMRSPTVVGALEPQADRAIEIHHRPVAAEMQRLLVGVDQLLLALELLADQLLDLGDIHVEQRRERADIDDVLEQLALARVGVFAIADLGQRHADDGDVVAEFRRRHRLGRIVEQIAARLDRGDVLVPGLRVHRHHEIDAAAGAEMAGVRRCAPRTRSAGPGCSTGRCCAAPPGMPMRRMERANSSLALAEPEPLTLANWTTKSFTLWSGMLVLRESYR